MLNRLTCLIFLLPVILFCSCKNDDDTPAVSDVLPHLVEVEHYYYDITHKYSSAERIDLVDADTVLTVTTERWHWSGDTLNSIVTMIGDAIDHTQTYTPTAYGIRLIDSRYPASETRYIISDGILDSIVRYESGSLTWTCQFGYTDGTPSSALVKSWINGVETASTLYMLQFDNGDLISLSYQSMGYTFTKHYTYGSAPNYYRLTDNSLTYLNLSRHIALSETVATTDDGGETTTEDHTFNYLINNGVAESMDITNESFVGKYHNIYKHHYTYRYEQ